MASKTALVATAAVVLSIAPARADVAPGIQKLISDNYQLTCAAVLDPSDANMTAALAPLSADFVSIDLKGKQTKRDDLAKMMKQQLKAFHATSCDTKIDTATQPDSNTVIVTTLTNVAGNVQTSDGNHQVEEMSKSEDTWAFSAGKWMETKSKDLHSTVKVDGKVVQDQGQ